MIHIKNIISDSMDAKLGGSRRIHCSFMWRYSGPKIHYSEKISVPSIGSMIHSVAFDDAGSPLLWV